VTGWRFPPAYEEVDYAKTVDAFGDYFPNDTVKVKGIST
jgi:hypothetical protein